MRARRMKQKLLRALRAVVLTVLAVAAVVVGNLLTAALFPGL